MPIMRFRLLGNRADVDEVLDVLEGIERLEHVEELDGLEPATRDDSSSAESVDDNASHTYVIEVDAPDDELADQVREVAESCATRRNAGIEFIDDF
ncbi:MAG: hypothetical protein J0H50_14325 [Xanthomonadales bacterium]|nr:hypothetical protein [Xanthomonadales bacterium]